MYGLHWEIIGLRNIVKETEIKLDSQIQGYLEKCTSVAQITNNRCFVK